MSSRDGLVPLVKAVLGLVGLDWEELDDDEFFFWIRVERRGGGREV